MENLVNKTVLAGCKGARYSLKRQINVSQKSSTGCLKKIKQAQGCILPNRKAMFKGTRGVWLNE